MRPPELDVTYVLEQLDCFVTEDDASGGDEPYLWILGFKIDADTIGPPAAGSLLPTLNVQVFEGAPFFRHVVGGGHVRENRQYPISPRLGTRTCRLKPARLPLIGWFPALVGVICLLWDEDGFSPNTSEAGFARFKKVIGPALSTEVNSLLTGAYDTDLSKDGSGNPTPITPSVPWRLGRIANADGRKYAVKAMVKKVKSTINSEIKDAITDAAGLDELLDPDDLLGAEAQVNLASELVSGITRFALSFTEDEANYQIRGSAIGHPVRKLQITETQVSNDRDLEAVEPLKLSVCNAPEKTYMASVFRQDRTAKVVLESLLGPPPSEVRWIVGDQILPDGTSTIQVNFAPPDVSGLDSTAGSTLTAKYPGGPGSLTCKAERGTLEITANGAGVYSGKIVAVAAFAGDPSLSPTPAPASASELIALGYDRSLDLELPTIEIEMSSEFIEDLTDCLRMKLPDNVIPEEWGKPGGVEHPDWLDLAARFNITDIVTLRPVDVASDVSLSSQKLRRVVSARWHF